MRSGGEPHGVLLGQLGGCVGDLRNQEPVVKFKGVVPIAGDANLGRLHRDAGALVVERFPASSQADLQPAFGEQINRRQLAGEHRGMSKVAVEHKGPTLSVVVRAAAVAIAAMGPTPSSKWSGTNIVE
jgi:hypothetical protein